MFIVPSIRVFLSSSSLAFILTTNGVLPIGSMGTYHWLQIIKNSHA
jgi:hypothetical protein